MRIPDVITYEWVKVCYEHLYDISTYSEINTAIGNKDWIYTAFNFFQKNSEIEFPEHMKKLYPDIYDCMIVNGYNSMKTKSILCMNNRIISNKTLSTVNMTDEDKGKIFKEISDKCDINELVNNETCIINRDIIYHHDNIVSILLEVVCGSNKSEWSGCKPCKHGRYVPESKSREKYVWKGDVKSINKKYKITLDNKDLVKPNKSWTKNKFKKLIESEKDKIKNYYKDDINLMLGYIIMNEKDYIPFSNEKNKTENSIESKYGKSVEEFEFKTNKRLDKWQYDFIKSSRKGNTLLLGPTSGGKTYASMRVVNDEINDCDNKSIIIFMAPNCYLSIQTYSTIMNSFSGINISLLTKGIQDISTINNDKKVRILVGNPEEILVFLLSNNFNLNVKCLIIDEIHMIDSVPEIPELIKLCKCKTIGLSATISENGMNEISRFIKSVTNNDVHNIVYKDRPTELITESLNIPDLKENDLFDIIKDSKTPTLIFENDDIKCINRYKEMISFLNEKEKSEFSGWIEYQTLIEPIQEYNITSCKIHSDYSYNYGRKCKPAVEKMSSSIIAQKKKKYNILDTCYTKLIDIFKNKTSNRGPKAEPSENIVKIANKYKLKIDKTSEYIDKIQILEKIDEVKQQLDDINPSSDISVLTPDDIKYISGFNRIKSPYLQLGSTKGVQDIIDILNSSDSNIDKSNIDRLKRICEAERCDFKIIKPILHLLSEGLSYGLGILIENIPYVIQLKVMSLLKEKKIDLIFASQEMKMGINFPIKTCIIIGDNKDYDIASMIQMAGRAGRRGYDTKGYAYYVNIPNSDKANVKYLKDIKIKDEDYKPSVCSEDYHDTIIEKITISMAENKIDSFKSKYLFCKSNDIQNLNSKQIKNLFERLENDNCDDYNENGIDFVENYIKSIKDVTDNDTKEVESDVLVENEDEFDNLEEWIKSRYEFFESLYEYIVMNENIEDNYHDVVKRLFVNRINNYEIYKCISIQKIDKDVLKHHLDVIGSHIQKIYLYYRNIKYKEILEILEDMFEFIHQTKYQI